MNINSIEIIRPDDWHVHLRDGEMLTDTTAASGKHFSRILAMPNLQPPLTQITDVIAYRQRIETYNTKTPHLKVFHSFYINSELKPDSLLEAKQYNFILGSKLYPANVTTNSEAGVKNLKTLYPMFDLMQSLDLVLQIHGEDTKADIFDREKIFIEKELGDLVQNFPRLRIVIEHISTRTAVDFVTNSPKNIAATITPQHLMFNRNDLLHQGIKPHLYCLPILKRLEDQQAIIKAATSGNPKFFAGSDSAPHVLKQKESACGCAGCFSAPFALLMYAQVFEQTNKMNNLELFVSRSGADFYNLSYNKEKIVLTKRDNIIPSKMNLGLSEVVPLAAGQTLKWNVDEN